MGDKIWALFKSRRFWAAVSGVVVVVSGVLGMDIDPEVISQFVMLIAAWVIGDSIQKTE